MAGWGIPFVVALGAAVLGFGGLTAESAEHIHVPFLVFMGLLVFLLVSLVIKSRAPPS